MSTFNATLSDDLQGSGQVKIVPKTNYPLNPPQQPSDFRPAGSAQTQGRALTDWSGPPVNANYLVFGYTAVQNSQIVLYGWVFDVNQANTASAQLFGKVYLGSLDESGARKVAEDFACDITKQFGGGCLTGSRIYFQSDRTGHKEIWSMNYDGSDQKQFTDYRTITSSPGRLAGRHQNRLHHFPLLPSSRAAGSALRSSVPKPAENLGLPQIFVHSLETGRKLVYYNQHASLNVASDFMPDSRHLLINSTAGGGFSQIFMTDLDGGGLRRITNTRRSEVIREGESENRIDHCLHFRARRAAATI